MIVEDDGNLNRLFVLDSYSLWLNQYWPAVTTSNTASFLADNACLALAAGASVDSGGAGVEKEARAGTDCRLS